MDVAGPLIPAKDIGGLYTRWMLVGTLTWAVPAESDKLKVPEVPDAEGDEPQIDINPEEPNENQEEGKALKDKEGEEGKEEGDEAQVRVWEEEEEGNGEKEGEKDPALPGGGLPPPPYLLPPPEKKEGGGEGKKNERREEEKERKKEENNYTGKRPQTAREEWEDNVL